MRRRGAPIDTTFVHSDAPDGSFENQTDGLTRRLRSAATNFESYVPAVEGLARQVVGDQEGAQKAYQEYGDLQQRAQAIGPDVQTMDDVRRRGSTPEAYAEFAATQAVNAVPDILATVATGGFGGAVGGTIARRAGLRAATAAAERQAAKEAAPALAEAVVKAQGSDAAERLARRQLVEETTQRTLRDRTPEVLAAQRATEEAAVKAGQIVGSTAGQYPGVVADSVEALKNTDQEGALKIGGADIVSAAFGSLPAERFLSRLGGGAARQVLEDSARKILPRVAKEFATQGALEGGVGVGQAAIQLAGHKWVDDNVDLVGPEAFDRYLAEAVGGFFAGGTISGVHTAGAAGVERWKEGAQGRGEKYNALKERLVKNIRAAGAAAESKLGDIRDRVRAGETEGAPRPKPGDPINADGSPANGADFVVSPDGTTVAAGDSTRASAADFFARAQEGLNRAVGAAPGVAAKAKAGIDSIIDRFKKTDAQVQNDESIETESDEVSRRTLANMVRDYESGEMPPELQGAMGNRAPNQNPIQFETKTQDVLATIIPRDHALWQYPDTAQAMMRSAEKIFTGEERTETDDRHIGLLQSLAPDKVARWEAANLDADGYGGAMRVAKRLTENRRLSARERAAEREQTNKPTVEVLDTLGKTFDGQTAVTRTARVRERSPMAAEATVRGPEPTSTTEFDARTARDPSTADITETDLNDAEAIDPRDSDAEVMGGFGSGISEADAVQDSPLDKLPNTDPTSREYPALQRAAREELLGGQPDLETGGFPGGNESRIFKEGTNEKLYSEKLNSASTVKTDKTFRIGGVQRAKLLELGNMVQYQRAKEPGMGALEAIQQSIADLKLAGVNVDPSTFSEGAVRTIKGFTLSRALEEHRKQPSAKTISELRTLIDKSAGLSDADVVARAQQKLQTETVGKLSRADVAALRNTATDADIKTKAARVSEAVDAARQRPLTSEDHESIGELQALQEKYLTNAQAEALGDAQRKMQPLEIKTPVGVFYTENLGDHASISFRPEDLSSNLNAEAAYERALKAGTTNATTLKDFIAEKADARPNERTERQSFDQIQSNAVEDISLREQAPREAPPREIDAITREKVTTQRAIADVSLNTTYARETTGARKARVAARESIVKSQAKIAEIENKLDDASSRRPISPDKRATLEAIVSKGSRAHADAKYAQEVAVRYAQNALDPTAGGPGRDAMSDAEAREHQALVAKANALWTPDVQKTDAAIKALDNSRPSDINPQKLQAQLAREKDSVRFQERIVADALVEAGRKIGLAELKREHDNNRLSTEKYGKQRKALEEDDAVAEDYFKRADDGEFDGRPHVTEVAQDKSEVKREADDVEDKLNAVARAHFGKEWAYAKVDKDGVNPFTGKPTPSKAKMLYKALSAKLTPREAAAERLRQAGKRKATTPEAVKAKRELREKYLAYPAELRSKLDLIEAARDVVDQLPSGDPLRAAYEKLAKASNVPINDKAPRTGKLDGAKDAAARETARQRSERIAERAKGEPEYMRARKRAQRITRREAAAKAAASNPAENLLDPSTAKPDADSKQRVNSKALSDSPPATQAEARDARLTAREKAAAQAKRDAENKGKQRKLQEQLDETIDDGVEAATNEDGEHDLKAEASMLNALLERMGLGGHPVTVEALPEHRRTGPGEPGGSYVGGTIYINPALKGPERIEVLAHELGHHVIRASIAEASGGEVTANELGYFKSDDVLEMLRVSNPDLHAAIKSDFESWAAKNPASRRVVDARASRAAFHRARALLSRNTRSKETTNDLSIEKQQYAYSMDEYIADNIARALAGKHESQTVIGKFFNDIAAKLRAVYDALFAKGNAKWAPAPSVDKWVQGLFDANVRDVSEAIGQPVSKETADAGIRAAVENAFQGPVFPARPSKLNTGAPPPPGPTPAQPNTPPPRDPKSFRDMLRFVRGTLRTPERKILDRVLSRGAVDKRLQEIYKDNPGALRLLDDAKHGLEGRIALAYFAWKDGKLTTGPEATNALFDIDDTLRSVLNVSSDGAYAQRIFDDIATGYISRVEAAGKTYDIRDLETRARGKLNATLNHFSDIAEKIGEPLSKFWESKMSRAFNSGIPAYRHFASLIQRPGGKTGDDRGFNPSVVHTTARYVRQAGRVFEGLSERDMHKALTYLQRGPSASKFPDVNRNVSYAEFAKAHFAREKAARAPGARLDKFVHGDVNAAFVRQANEQELKGFIDTQIDKERGLQRTIDAIVEDGGEAGAQTTLLQQIVDERKLAEARLEKLPAARKAESERAGTPEGTRPEIRAAIDKARKLMDDLHAYATDAGVKLPRRSNFWPVVLDLRNDTAKTRLTTLYSQPHFEARIRELFGSKDKPSDLPIADLVKNLVDGATQGEHGAPTTGAGAPNFKSANYRLSQFVYDLGSPADIDTFAALQSKDPAEVLGRYVEPLVKRAEYARRFGDDGARANRLLEQMKAQGATDAQVGEARNTLKAALGTYGAEGSPLIAMLSPGLSQRLATPRTRSIIHGLQAYQNARLLPLATLSSLVDPIGIAVRTGGDFKTAWDGFKLGMKALRDKGTRDDIHRLLETLGSTEDIGTLEALQQGFGGGDSPSSRKVNEFVFKWNGLQGWTRATRYMALKASNGFMLKHAAGQGDSGRYLRELGLKPGDVQPGVGGNVKLLTDAERASATPAEVRRDDRVRKAMMQFVDEAILRPNSQQTPLWYSDPYVGLVTQYKAFAYALYDQIGGRIAREMSQGNLKVLLPALAYLPVTIMAELLRELLQYGPDGNPRRKSWGAAEYTGLAVSKQLAMRGPKLEVQADIVNDFKQQRVPGQSQTGPTISQAIDVVDGGDNLRTLEAALPASALWKRWNDDDRPTG